MPNYQKMYLIAVSAMADALDELDKLNIGAANEVLTEALYHVEEVYITQGEDDSDTSSDTSYGSEPSEPPRRIRYCFYLTIPKKRSII